MPQASSIICLILSSLFLISCQEDKVPPVNATTPEPPAGMAYIPGGSYLRGNDRPLGTTAKYPEESPVHDVTVSPFFLDKTEVTNAEFLRFVTETDYITTAERGFTKEEFPNAPEDQLQPGAIIFTPPPEGLDPYRASVWSWWTFSPEANWRHPHGTDSNITEIMDHPVTCITFEDAKAYASWAGKRLPTEAEWERAARGGLDQNIFTWGDNPLPTGKWMANVFQGDFPANNTALDGYLRTAPVKSFPPNAYGLYDMAGNIWEICSDYYSPIIYQKYKNARPTNPKGPETPISQIDYNQFLNTGVLSPGKIPHPAMIMRTIRGGSYLCHHSYCMRFRPAARFYTESITPTNHIGFRCARDLDK